MHTTFTIREPKGNTHLGHMLSLMANTRTFSNTFARKKENGQHAEGEQKLIQGVLKTLINKNTDVYTKSDKIQIIEAIKNLTLSKSINKLSTCKFSLKYKSLEHGICTSYGSCRFHGNDFMNQVWNEILKTALTLLQNVRVAAPF